MENTQQTKNTQNKSKQLIKPISFYHKYNCDSCNYHTNYKNSYNKHIKSAKHLSFVPKEGSTEVDSNVVREDPSVNREKVIEDLQTEIVMDASMGFITVEEFKKDTKNESITTYNEDNLNKIVDLMNKLNDKINNNIKVKCFYFGLGFLFHSVFNLFIRS
jgi:hypothetical protein